MAVAETRLRAREATLATLAATRKAEAAAEVAGVVAECRTLAGRAIGPGVVEAADGRPTLARLRRGRYLTAARVRLGSLKRRLVDRNAEARREFYMVAFRAWAEDLGPGRVARAEPAASDADRVAASLMFGRPAAETLGMEIERRISTLQSALVLAGARNPPRKPAAILDDWARQAESGIATLFGRMLVSSLTLADVEALGDVVGEPIRTIGD